MGLLINYLDGRYQERLKELKSDVGPLVNQMLDVMDTDGQVDAVTKVWKAYKNFSENTVMHVAPWQDKYDADLTEKHCHMITTEGILEAVDNSIFTSVINQILTNHQAKQK